MNNLKENSCTEYKTNQIEWYYKLTCCDICGGEVRTVAVVAGCNIALFMLSSNAKTTLPAVSAAPHAPRDTKQTQPYDLAGEAATLLPLPGLLTLELCHPRSPKIPN
ncbi:hypothetical protein E2C01_036265 [Portunus trituberculatus]|uniref:Uncharacterized protein n=1 Tax=Portunus trituberculatus TaxID=210409 RepID=A0A5B7FC01_PORTR|nr:hypothetical protein [Portunus trituberculatus]